MGAHAFICRDLPLSRGQFTLALARPHEPGVAPQVCLQDCAAIPHLAATFMREVEAGHLSVFSRDAVDLQRIAAQQIRQRRLHRTILHFLHCGREWRDPQNSLSLARLRSAPRLCT